ncbi:MAG: hypothetical protein ABFD46_03315 [Armatimonadota bacterium]
MANRLIGIWILFVTVIFIAGFFSQKAASLEPFGRYIYVAAVFISVAAIVIRLMRRRYSRVN